MIVTDETFLLPLKYNILEKEFTNEKTHHHGRRRHCKTRHNLYTSPLRRIQKGKHNFSRILCKIVNVPIRKRCEIHSFFFFLRRKPRAIG